MTRRLTTWYRQQQASLMYRRGLTYLEQRDYERAIAAFSEVMGKDIRRVDEAQVMRGISRSGAKDTAGAIADFETVIHHGEQPGLNQDTAASELTPSKLTPSKAVLAKAHHQRGLLRQKANNEAGALADWSAAIAYFPTYPEPHYHRALVSLGQAHHSAALADLDAALAANPTMVLAYLQRGNLRYQLGDIPGAVADWTLALCNDFSLEEARLNLASIQQANCDARLSAVLEKPLAALGLSVEVNHKETVLDIHVHRELGTGINYYKLPDVIRECLVPAILTNGGANVSHFQLTGHLAEVNRPEWSQSYELYKGQPCPPSQWQTAFSALVLFPPFGIPAFIQAARVKKLYDNGQYLEAVSASKAVKGLCVAGSVALGFFTLLPLGYAAYDSMKETPTFRVAKEQPTTDPLRTPYQQMFQDDAELN